MPDLPPVLILAAGASKRMGGRDKLAQIVDGQSLLEHVVDVALGTGAAAFVTLPDPGTERAALLTGKPVKILSVPDADSGMAASLRVWPAAAPKKAPGVVVMLADMPDVTTHDLNTLMQAFSAAGATQIIRATNASQTPGHPVIFPRHMFEDFADLRGDQGARPLLLGQDVIEVALPNLNATTDLDTPQDWAAWRADRNSVD
ncbi:MAG: nucleotidyltransferase family protein [Marinosulfonomonas sp.]|nr:nucleotidyltransferase family protein [Marinosulfonomonas sp.]